MEWIAENWFFVVLLILFVAMHMFGHGHGGHGGHGGHRGGSGNGGTGGEGARPGGRHTDETPTTRREHQGHAHH